MTYEIDHLATHLVQGAWNYDASNHVLKKSLGSKTKLAQHHLVNEDGYLDETFKAPLTQALGPDVLRGTEGPFGDTDIFCGEIDETTYDIHYAIELHHIKQDNIDALNAKPHIEIQSD